MSPAALAGCRRPGGRVAAADPRAVLLAARSSFPAGPVGLGGALHLAALWRRPRQQRGCDCIIAGGPNTQGAGDALVA